MTVARKLVVDRASSGWYQCVSRCVRRAFLLADGCEHRRQWVRDRIEVLTGIFSIDVAAYAVMSNHYHVLVHIDPERQARLSNEDIARRWLQLFPGRRPLPDGPQSPSEQYVRALASDQRRIKVLRKRLTDLSWFMRCLNEWIARRANREDRCTGRFWEGRFKCRRLLDVAARLASAVYIDLNPIRAAMAATPEDSDHTSVQARIDDLRGGRPHAGWLSPIGPTTSDPGRPALAPIPLESYLELVDATGRLIRAGKRGSIPEHLRPILERLGIDDRAWSHQQAASSDVFGTAVGAAVSLAREAVRRGCRRLARVLDVYDHAAPLPGR